MRSWVISITLHLIVILAVVWYLYQPRTQDKAIHYEPSSHIIEASIVYIPQELSTTTHTTTTVTPETRPTDLANKPPIQPTPIQNNKPQSSPKQNKQAEIDQRFQSFSQALNQYLQSLRLKNIKQIEIDFTLDHQGTENIYIKGNLPNHTKQLIQQWISTQSDLQNLPLDHPIKIHQPITIHHH